MFVRRLVFLFLVLSAVALLIVARLAQLQLVQADKWQAQAESLVKRHLPIETTRGTILDRYGRVLAQDRACFDVAIDYRAMNLDDKWIRNLAVQQMLKAGVKERRQRLEQLPNEKLRIAEQIENIPQMLAGLCNVPVEEIVSSYQLIRERMDALRQSRWTNGRYDKNLDKENLAEGLVDPDRTIDLKEARSAHTLIHPLADVDAFRLKKELDNYPGLEVVDAKRRVYPYGAVGAHIIGVMRRVNREEYKNKLPHFDRGNLIDDEPGNLKGYLPGDELGALGMELLAEDQLRGARGVRLLEVGGEEQLSKRQNAVSGQDVKLTIDIELQKKLTQAILDPQRKLRQGQDGEDHQVALVIIALDGQILTMITTPTYDLNTAREPARFRELLTDEANKPLLNRAVASVYPPGSTVKPLVAAAALMENKTTPQTTIVCNGYYFKGQPGAFRCSIYSESHSTHGPLQLSGALERSCNIYFYTMGDRLGLDLLTQWFSNFGLGTPTGIGMVEEVRGSLPKPGRTSDPDLYRREAIFMGIGQGPISTTPLQMANAYATLLRGGVYVQPRLLLDGQSAQEQKMRISPEALAEIRRGMELVVAGDHGTAHKILKLRQSVAGKTGSADARRRAYGPDGKPAVDADGKPVYRDDADAWFVGYVPADRPKFVIAAVKEFGGHGGTSATPLVKEAVLELERHGYLSKLD